VVIPNYAIWLVVFFFYFIEHIKKVDQTTVIVKLSGSNQFDIKTDIFRLELLGSTYTILPFFPSFGKSIFLGSYLLQASASHISKRRELFFLRSVRRHTIFLSWMEPAAFFFYFIAAPVISVTLGFSYVLKILIPIHSAFLFFSIWQLVSIAKLLKLGKSSCARLIFEVIISPGLIPALSKKISSQFRIHNDVLDLLLSVIPDDKRQAVINSIKKRTLELLEFNYFGKEEVDTYLNKLGIEK